MKSTMAAAQPSAHQKERFSNLELLRILAMLLIIAHHYVGNSGIADLYDRQNVTLNMVFLQLWAMWGKAAINVFVLISGYFMCRSHLTPGRVLKLWLEIKFYDCLLFPALCLLGYHTFNFQNLWDTLFYLESGINRGFTASFMAFYLFIPFYNQLIHAMDRRKHGILVIMLLIFYTGTGTVFASASFSEVGWYMALYFTASYLREYPSRFTESCKWNGLCFLVFTVLAGLRILVCDWFYPQEDVYFLLSDSHKLHAFVLGLTAFLTFKNMKIPQSRLINRISATTFGVLLIHAYSDGMRTLLWKDLLNVPGMYTAGLAGLVVHAAVSMLGVFAVCAGLDYLRIVLIQKPVLNFLFQKFPGLLKPILPVSDEKNT